MQLSQAQVTGGLLSKVSMLLSASLLVSSLGCWAGAAITSGWTIFGLFLLVLLGIFGVNVLVRVNPIAGILAFLAWSFPLGAMCGPAVHYSVQSLGWQTVELAFLFSASVMVGIGTIGATMKRDISALGPILFFALIGLIIVRLIFMFLPHVAGIHVLLGGFSAILFAGYFLYDFWQAARDEDSWPAAVIHTMNILLDFWNFFLSILEIMRGSK